MKLLYPIQPSSRQPVMYAVKDADVFYFTHTTNLPMAEMDIAELDPDNKALCLDLLATVGKVDDAGLSKYHVIDGELHVTDGWKEHTNEQDYPR